MSGSVYIPPRKGDGQPAQEPGTGKVTILVVDDDEVLGQVLSRVLQREGYVIVQALTVSQALEMDEGHKPDLALLDLCLPDGDGVALAGSLRQRRPDLPLILMTAYPLRLREHPELTGRFTRVLAKPVNVEVLRQAVEAALRGETGPAPLPAAALAAPVPAPKSTPAALPDPDEVPRRVSRPSGPFKSTLVALAVVALAVGVAGVLTGAVPLPWQGEGVKVHDVPEAAPLTVELVPDVPHTLKVPEDVRRALGMRKDGADAVAPARVPTQTRPLVLPASTGLDPARVQRVRARFAPAEVVEIGQVPLGPGETASGRTEFRELRPGDQVHKGQVLGVFYSVDVGSKKNDLIDALVQRHLDREILDAAEKYSSAVTEVFLLNARRNLQGDENRISQAENMLVTWNIPEEDIRAARDEAARLIARKERRDKSKDGQWARVELRASEDATIVERNVSLHEVVVDATTNLFVLAKINRLTVVANAPEDDLKALHDLPRDRRFWTVRTAGLEPGQGLRGPIDEIGILIDPNQHTGVVKGHLDNPGDLLRAGQYATVSIELPPPDDVVEIPTRAVVDDGRQCVVFVQSARDPAECTLRRVLLTHRFDRTVFVRSRLSEKEKQRTPEDEEQGLLPPAALAPGEKVLTSGVLELKKELEDREAERQSRP